MFSCPKIVSLQWQQPVSYTQTGKIGTETPDLEIQPACSKPEFLESINGNSASALFLSVTTETTETDRPIPNWHS